MKHLSVHALEPGIDLALRLVPRNAVALLQPAGELLALALDHIEVVVGELAPLLLSLALELFPVAFDTIPIHRFTPCAGMSLISEKTRRAKSGSDTRGEGSTRRA